MEMKRKSVFCHDKDKRKVSKDSLVSNYHKTLHKTSYVGFVDGSPKGLGEENDRGRLLSPDTLLVFHTDEFLSWHHHDSKCSYSRIHCLYHLNP